jgi:hypothetical protein
MAEVVNYWLSSAWRPKSDDTPVSVGFVLDEVALEHVLHSASNSPVKIVSTSLLYTFICGWYSRPIRGCSMKGLSFILTPRNVLMILDFVVGCCAIDLTQMLTHHSPVLRARTCILLQLLSRYSCRALQLNWTQRLQEDLESLMHDSNKMVQVVSVRIVHVLNSGLYVMLCIPVFISLID